MVDQLLKYVPTKEEIETLNQYAEDVHRMAKADRFFYQMGKIPRYEQKLKSISFRKRFTERLLVAQSQADSVCDAATELSSSDSVERLFVLVLALGNYMNKGARGNSPGFKLSSLNKLRDTKTQDGKSTLLHFLAEELESSSKNPSLETIESQTKNVSEAARVDLKQLRQEISQLKIGLKVAQDEIQALVEENSSAPRLESFCSSASGQLRDVDERLGATDEKFKATAARFGEKQAESHDFFKMFAEFFAALNEAKAENEKREQERRDAARQEKLKIDRQERISRTASKNKSLDEMGAMLRSGEMFDDGPKRRKPKKKLLN